jgi:hypothetical protein
MRRCDSEGIGPAIQRWDDSLYARYRILPILPSLCFQG